MTNKKGILVLASSLLAFGPLPRLFAEETIEAIETQSIAACEQHNSISAKMRLSTEMVMGAALVHSESNGSYEHMRNGDQVVFRVEMKNVVTSKVQGQERKVEQTVLTVSDGQSSYTLTTQPGQKPTATKGAPKSGQTVLADRNFFASLKRQYNIRVLPDEEVEGKPAWALEATPKQQIPNQPAKSIYYVHKDSGIRVKNTSHDKDGRRIQLTALTEIKLDAPIDPRRFMIDIPKGVTIVDTTGK